MPDYQAALTHLSAIDPVMARLIDVVGPCRLEPGAYGSHFAALARSIISQQLSTKAAATIHGRFLELFNGETPSPGALLALPEETLRGVGLSRQKLGYLRDLAAHAVSGQLPLASVEELDDEAIIRALTQVKGIGRWTVQMFLLFRLGRPDVLAELDLGLQKAAMQLYGLPEMPRPRELLALGERWRPHASVASWYLWRSLELPVGAL